jgi:hypothetical protein
MRSAARRSARSSSHFLKIGVCRSSVSVTYRLRTIALQESRWRQPARHARGGKDGAARFCRLVLLPVRSRRNGNLQLWSRWGAVDGSWRQNGCGGLPGLWHGLNPRPVSTVPSVRQDAGTVPIQPDRRAAVAPDGEPVHQLGPRSRAQAACRFGGDDDRHLPATRRMLRAAHQQRRGTIRIGLQKTGFWFAANCACSSVVTVRDLRSNDASACRERWPGHAGP